MSLDRISDRCGLVWEAQEDGRAAPSEPAEPDVPKTWDTPRYTVRREFAAPGGTHSEAGGSGAHDGTIHHGLARRD